MSTIDYIISLIPVAESVFSVALFLWLYRSSKEKKHIQLSLFFMFLGLFYLMSVLFYSGVQQVIAFLYVLSLPVTLSILPSIYIFLSSMTGNNKGRTTHKQIHYAPAIIFFWMLLLFWFEPVSIQHDYISGNLQDLSDLPLLSIIRKVYQIGVYFIIYAQFTIYFVLLTIVLLRFKKRIENHYSLSEQLNLSEITYFVLFIILLYVLILFSHFLGVSKYPVSRIIFNVLSSVIIIFILIRALKICKTTNQEDVETDKV